MVKRTPEEQASYIEHLEAEVERLKREKGLDGARDGLTHDARAGIYRDEHGSAFCPKCLANKQRNPLHGDAYRWKCGVCDARYPNPDAPTPRVVSSYNPFP